MFQKIKKVFSKKNHSGKPREFSFNPKRDWAVLVSLFFLANIILISFLTFNYFRIVNDRGQNAGGNFDKIDSINEEALQAVLEEFRQKNNRYELLLSEPPRTSDPSI